MYYNNTRYTIENIHKITPRDIYYTVINGHLDKIKWLHENRIEVFSRGIMDVAAGFYGAISRPQNVHSDRPYSLHIEYIPPFGSHVTI